MQELTIYQLAFKRLTLKVLNLQSFSLKYSKFEHLEPDAPKLSTFIYWGQFRYDHRVVHRVVHFVHPETIRVLEYQSYIFTASLDEFHNLERLIAMHDSRLAFNIKNLTKLKTIDLISVDEPITIDRPDLKITSAGFEKKSVKFKHYNSSFYGEQLLEEYGYDALLNPVPFEVHVFYQGLVLIGFENGLPESFFRKLPYIRRLAVTKPMNPVDVLEFLRKSQCPGLIITCHPCLGQNFYDLLPSSSCLSFLNLRDHSCKDFDFLSKLTKLEHLILLPTAKLPVDPIYRVIKKSKFFSRVDLGINPSFVMVNVGFDVYTKVAYGRIGGLALPKEKSPSSSF